MPLPPAHKRVTFNGTLSQAPGGGSEIFSFGFADASTMTVVETAAAAGASAASDWNISGIGIFNTATLEYVVCEDIAADGKVSASARYDVSPTAGTNSSPCPSLCCAAVTLETGVTSEAGRKIRGRFYPPAVFAGIIGSTSDPTDVQNYAGAWRNFMADMIGVAHLVPAVASSSDGGMIVNISGVSVDNIVDTQRRRKNQLTSVRSAVIPI